MDQRCREVVHLSRMIEAVGVDLVSLPSWRNDGGLDESPNPTT
jgi:hypothetical protein